MRDRTFAVVGDGRRHQAQAQRADQDLALTEAVLATGHELVGDRDRPRHGVEACNLVLLPHAHRRCRVGEVRRPHHAGQMGERRITRRRKRFQHRHGAERESVVVRNGSRADLDLTRARNERIRLCQIASDRRGRGDHLERRTGRVEPGGGDGSARIGGLVLRHSENASGRRLNHDHRDLKTVGGVDCPLCGVLDGARQTQRDRRRRCGRVVGQDVRVESVGVDRDDPPADVAVDLAVDDLLDLRQQCGRETRVLGDELGLLIGDDSGNRQLVTETVELGLVEARDRVLAVCGRRILGDLLCIERHARRVERSGQPGHRIGDGPLLRSLLRVEVDADDRSVDHHLRAIGLVDRRSRRLDDPHRQALIRTEIRVYVGRRPADRPAGIAPPHLDRGRIGPFATARQLPAIGDVDVGGVAVDVGTTGLRGHRGGTQSRPCAPESLRSLTGIVGQRRGGVDISLAELLEKVLCRLTRTVVRRGTGGGPDDERSTDRHGNQGSDATSQKHHR